MLALARYLLSNPDILKNGGLLFPGQHQYTRFMNVFHKVIRDNKGLFEANGVKEGELGSHSCRKGAITLVSAGCTVSPPMAAICLRAGWSMGPVKDRYIHYEKAGDQFVGRCATGISALGKEFSTSPVYWDFTNGPVGMRNRIDDIIGNNFATMNEVEGKSFDLLRFLFASVCFHHNFLDTYLHCEHKLRSSPLFIAASDGAIQKWAVVAFPWNSTSYTPFFTGIPPHVMMMTELESLRLKLVEHRNDIIDGIKDELDRRSLGGVDYQTKVVLDEVKKAHDEMLKRMECMKVSNTNSLTIDQLNNNNSFFYINDDDEEERDFFDDAIQEEGQREEVGTQPILIPEVGEREGVGTTINESSESSIQYDTDTYPQDYIDENYTDVSREGDSDGDEDGSLETPRPPTPPLQLESPSSVPTRSRRPPLQQKGRGIVISWQNVSNGNLRLVPKNFSIPKMSFPNMLTMWYCGDISKNVPPYRLLKACDVRDVKGGKQKISNMRCLVRHVERGARLAGMGHLILKKWDTRGVLDLYHATRHFFAFPTLVNGKQWRYEQLGWKTFYNILVKRKGRLYGKILESII